MDQDGAGGTCGMTTLVALNNTSVTLNNAPVTGEDLLLALLASHQIVPG